MILRPDTGSKREPATTPEWTTALRVMQGVGSNLFSQVVTFVTQIVQVPIFIAAWGRELYGEWLTISAVVAYASLLDFGMQLYVTNRLTQLRSSDRMVDYNSVLHSALSLSIVVSGVGMAIAIILSFSIPVKDMFRFHAISNQGGSWIVLLLAVYLITAIPAGLFGSSYRTIGEYPRGMMLTNTQRLVALSLTVAAAKLGGKPVHIALIWAIMPLATCAYVRYDLQKRHPEIELGSRKSDWRLAAKLVAPGSLFFLIQAVTAGAFEGSTVIVQLKFGAVAVAVYTTLRTMTNSMRQAAAAINQPLIPELTRLEARGDYEGLRRIHVALVRYSLFTALCLGILLHFTGSEIVALWTRGQIPYSPALAHAFILALVLQLPWIASSMVLLSANRHSRLALCYVASAGIGLLAAWLMSPWLGPVGVVAGLLCGDVLCCVWAVPLMVCHMIGQSLGFLLRHAVLLPIIMGGLLFGIVQVVSLLMDKTAPLVYFISVTGTVLLGGAALGYYVCLCPGERKAVTKALCRCRPVVSQA